MLQPIINKEGIVSSVSIDRTTPTGFEGSRARDAYLAKAVVLSVGNADLRQNLIVRTGTQDVRVEIAQGTHKGQRTRVVNPLAGKMEFDEIYVPGDTILVAYKIHDGKIHMAFTRGYYRLNHVFCKDVSPIPISLAVAAALTASVSFLVGGWTRKGLTAFVGSFAGLVLACILAKLFAPGFHLNGAVRPYAENLLYAGFPHLDLTEIFLAGIFLSCSGAVMDLSMDIAASIDEVKSKKPEIGFRELFGSGMAVGRSVVGTMTTTLLLAYSGGYTAMLMNFMGQGWKVQQIFNVNFVASEILNVFVGSFGLVAVAPLTAIAGAVMYSRKHR